MTTSDQINGDVVNGLAQNGNIYTVLSQNGDGNHATSQPAINGDGTSWAFVNHILNYPVVNDSVATFKSTPLGQRSLKFGDSAYRTFAVPVLPYFSWPLQLITPYAKKADDLGDKTLSRVDEKFPIVKKPTDELISDARSMASIPLRVGQTGKEHVLSTYGAELNKTGGNGLLGRGKAAVTTALILTSESLATVSSYLNEKKKQSREVVEEKTASS
ncbi:putative pathogenesis associated protein Cap20 [Schizothecium vesticola]|uniref:Pathogenesis associated protein Cap20 n=1 Tax=Schizothecium vesticola TaxID=314040 RepID=A0AA40JZL2_9PEZI|nr:putative pathogenesis associated protein Cap20 [Schizothecium vesticola]